MIFIKDKFEYEVKKFIVHYYEIESISDFSFLVILLANRAIENNEELTELFYRFTRGDNDYYLLLNKRFESLFNGVNSKDFLKIKEVIMESKKQKKQFKKSTHDLKIKYNKWINKFLYEELFWSKEELINHISKNYNNKTKEFISIDIYDDNQELIVKVEEFNLSNDFSYFNIRNQFNLNNKYVLDILIENIKNKAYSLLPKNIIYISNHVTNNDDELKQIERSYFENASPFIELINFEDYENNPKFNFKLELNLGRNNEEIIFSEINIYKDVPFVREKRISYGEFKLKENYLEIINYLFNNFQNISDKFKELFIKYSDTKEEFELIKKYINYKLNINKTLQKIDLMIKNKVDFINDINFVENDIYYSMIKSEFKNYYKFIVFFYPELIDTMEESKKVSLLSEVNLNGRELLLKRDLNWINEYINDKRKIYDQIGIKTGKFVGERGFITEVKKNIDSYKRSDENNILEPSIESEVSFWNRVINFFAHFSQETKKGDRKNQKNVYSKYEKLSDLKIRFLKIKTNDYSTYDISDLDLNYLDKILEDFNKFKDNMREEKFIY